MIDLLRVESAGPDHPLPQAETQMLEAGLETRDGSVQDPGGDRSGLSDYQDMFPGLGSEQGKISGLGDCQAKSSNLGGPEDDPKWKKATIYKKVNEEGGGLEATGTRYSPSDSGYVQPDPVSRVESEASLSSWSVVSSEETAEGRVPMSLVKSTPRRRLPVVPRRLDLTFEEDITISDEEEERDTKHTSPLEAGLSHVADAQAGQAVQDPPSDQGFWAQWWSKAPFQAYEGLILVTLLTIAAIGIAALGLLGLGTLAAGMRPFYAISALMASPGNASLVIFKYVRQNMFKLIH